MHVRLYDLIARNGQKSSFLMPDNYTKPAPALTASAAPPPTLNSAVRASLAALISLHDGGFLLIRPGMQDEQRYHVAGTLDAARGILGRQWTPMLSVDAALGPANEWIPPGVPCRTPQAIDAELLSCVRLYLAASRQGGLGEQSLLLMFVRIAALAWVLHPELGEAGAQGFAWQLIAAYAEEQRAALRAVGA
jgi:hypothetical protein